jgi:hypothetical protein
MPLLHFPVSGAFRARGVTKPLHAFEGFADSRAPRLATDASWGYNFGLISHEEFVFFAVVFKKTKRPAKWRTTMDPRRVCIRAGGFIFLKEMT